jgi:hypothetical protein
LGREDAGSSISDRNGEEAIMGNQAFIDRLLPAPVNGGFMMDDYWVWCGSVIQGEDGRFHMFASRWPKGLSFVPHWLTNSEVVRAVSDSPEGPYKFQEVVLPPRGREYWDGRMTHNPSICKCADTYLLYYTGTTYDGNTPTPECQEPNHSPKKFQARRNQRIGLATAKSVYGPWKRREEPILLPRDGKWDGLMTTNPAPCVREDGSVLLNYKSTAFEGDLLRMGVASADRFDGEYRRLKEDPIFQFDSTGDYFEDGFVWLENGLYHIVMKDMTGGTCGEKHAGVHAVSHNGVDWSVGGNPKAYSRSVLWSDGTVVQQGSLERPQLLIQDGIPTHLFAATADGPGGFTRASRTWNMVIPLKVNPKE